MPAEQKHEFRRGSIKRHLRDMKHQTSIPPKNKLERGKEMKSETESRVRHERRVGRRT